MMELEPLSSDFFERDAHRLARSLLGQRVVRRLGDEDLVGRIVELEVYGGADDAACHADSGVPTERTRSMFDEPSTAYIYRIYGMYDCLNVVGPPGPQGKVSAILLRALQPEVGLCRMAQGRNFTVEGELSKKQRWGLMSGPGKLCQALHIDRSLDGHPLTSPPLFIARGPAVDPDEIVSNARIGLNPKTCGDSAAFPWRYTIADSSFLSR